MWIPIVEANMDGELQGEYATRGAADWRYVEGVSGRVYPGYVSGVAGKGARLFFGDYPRGSPDVSCEIGVCV